ncbi:MAG: hypothetical protein ABIJ56_14615 [Pseudomonadota bacterium]
MKAIRLILCIAVLAWSAACDNGGGGSEAGDQLIGAECTGVENCDDDDPDTPALECVTGFKGGYCGRAGCTASLECPEGSLCAVVDGSNYCFLVCTEKFQCNEHRTLENESNCSSNIDPVEGGEEKLCIPPSGE